MLRILDSWLERFWVWLAGDSPAVDSAASRQPGPGRFVYVVQAGDTLKSLARRFHTSRWILADLNDLDGPGVARAFRLSLNGEAWGGAGLRVGQRLLIPRPGAFPLARAVPAPRAPGGPVEVEQGPCVTLVHAGDTLSAIAQRFGVTAAAILEANRLPDPDLIRPGRPLLIPGTESQPEIETSSLPEPASQEPSLEREPTPMLASPPDRLSPASGQPVSAPESEDLSGPYEYVVQPGDTLMAIARRFNVTVRAIIEANRIADVNWVQPGQRLVVPGASSPPGPGPAGEAEPGELSPPQPDGAWDVP